MTVAVKKGLAAIRWENGKPEIVTEDTLLAEILRVCLYEPLGFKLFCRQFMGASFDRAFTEQHDDFVEHITDPSIPKLVCKARRGFGKTTIGNAFMGFNACFRLQPFTLFTSSEYDIAQSRVEIVKNTIFGDPYIREIFGFAPPRYMDGSKDIFGKGAYKVCDSETNEPFALFVAKGAGQAVNGLLEYVAGRQQRPSLIFNDDGESRKTINNESIRIDYRRWVTDVLLPCAAFGLPDPVTNRWIDAKRGDKVPHRAIFIDTPKHPDAHIEHIMSDNDWVSVCYPLCKEIKGDTGQAIGMMSLVPEVTDEQVTKLWNKFRNDDPPNEGGFYREHMCVAMSPSGNVVPETFEYYSESDIDLNAGTDLIRMIVVDPARTSGEDSAYTAMLGVAIDTKNARIYLRELINTRLQPEQMYHYLFDMSRRLNTQIICVELEGVNDFLRGPLENQAFMQGVDVQWIWLKTRYGEAGGEIDSASKHKAKIRRAGPMISYYRPQPKAPNGIIVHEHSLKGSGLERQLKAFPNIRGRWDAIDAFAHIQQAMDSVGVYFEYQEDSAPSEDGTQRTSAEDWDRWVRSGAWRTPGI